MADDELDLKTLDDDELVSQMHDDLYDGLKEEIEEGCNILLTRGWTPYDILTKALVEGMRIVGIDFRDGILFVPEVLLAANAMKAGMAILRPLLAETGAPKIGKMVIGTVKGDIHDIGKNLVGMMMEGAGFEVVDLGINNPVEKYLEAIEEHEPDILGMSALLTTTMPYMKVVIDALNEKGIRNDHIVLVGGAPSTRASPMRSAPTPIAATRRWRWRQPRALLARRQGTLEAKELGGEDGGADPRARSPEGVTPAQAGVQKRGGRPIRRPRDKRPRLLIWIPAFAGMTVAGSARPPKSSLKQAKGIHSRVFGANRVHIFRGIGFRFWNFGRGCGFGCGRRGLVVASEPGAGIRDRFALIALGGGGLGQRANCDEHGKQSHFYPFFGPWNLAGKRGCSLTCRY